MADTALQREESRFSSTVNGEPSVTIAGVFVMPELSAECWALLSLCTHQLGLDSVKDPAASISITFGAQGQKTV